MSCMGDCELSANGSRYIECLVSNSPLPSPPPPVSRSSHIPYISHPYPVSSYLIHLVAISSSLSSRVSSRFLSSRFSLTPIISFCLSCRPVVSSPISVRSPPPSLPSYRLIARRSLLRPVPRCPSYGIRLFQLPCRWYAPPPLRYRAEKNGASDRERKSPPPLPPIPSAIATHHPANSSHPTATRPTIRFALPPPPVGMRRPHEARKT